MLRFRDIDVENSEEVQHLVDWANDRSIRHLFLRFADQEAYERPLALDLAQRRLRESLHQGRKLHLILWHDQIVGEVSLDMASKAVPNMPADTAWLGLVIGEAHARGQGLGRKAMLHIEGVARNLGAARAQIGVFAFNERAQVLYKTLGYQEVSRRPEFTWWRNKRWTDILMDKPL